MKRLILLVSLVLFSFFPSIDNQKEQPYLANTDITLSLSCPDYLPPKLNINETTDISKSDSATGIISNDWYSRAINNIRQEEYNITYSEEAGTFQSPNRANNIRFTYHNNGFTAKTMQTKIPLFDVNDRSLTEKDRKYKELEEWSVELRIKNYELGIKNSQISAIGNSARLENDKIRIDYANTCNGMRQEFVIKENTSGEDGIELQMNVNKMLKMIVSKDAVTFFSKKDGAEKMQYSSLKVWDANEKVLDAYFEKRGAEDFAIVVEDKDAVYPVTIDPLTISPNWHVVCDQLSRFGDGISSGDINGDGYDEVVISAPIYEPNGVVYIYKGSATGSSMIPDKILYGIGRGFGSRVDCKADVNNDGYNDLIIGDPKYDSSTGRVLIYYGSSSGISDSANRIINPQGGNEFGYCVSIAGSVNGDGYSDIIIGVRNYVIDSLKVGGCIYLGSVNGIISNSPDWYASMPVNSVSDLFGFMVSDAGDVNNDGYYDVMVSDIDFNKVYAFYGSADKEMFEPANWSVNENAADRFGWSVSAAGDVNSDGFDDAIIGSIGSVYLYYGSQSGLTPAPVWEKHGDNSFGNRATSAGDFNNDGFGDIVVGDFYKCNLFLGSASGPGSLAAVLPGTSINACSGDVNGDGISDVLSAYDPDGFGYFGMENIVQSMKISPEDTLIEPMHELSLSVLLKSQYEYPLQDVLVKYLIQGKHPESDSLFTDSCGLARISYSGQFVGKDTIIISAGNISDTAFAVWDYPYPVNISFLSISVSGRTIDLLWSTTSELNNYGFEIEKSNVKGQMSDEWSIVGFVPGNGTSTEIHNYAFTEKGLNTGKYNFRLKQIDYNGNFKYFELTEEVVIGIPLKYNLSQNYPNPFNSVTNLEFGISNLGFVSLKVYDVMGRKLVTIINENMEPRYYNVKFDAGNLSSGVYFYRMTAGDFVAVKKFVVLK